MQFCPVQSSVQSSPAWKMVKIWVAHIEGQIDVIVMSLDDNSNISWTLCHVGLTAFQRRRQVNTPNHVLLLSGGVSLAEWACQTGQSRHQPGTCCQTQFNCQCQSHSTHQRAVWDSEIENEIKNSPYRQWIDFHSRPTTETAAYKLFFSNKLV